MYIAAEMVNSIIEKPKKVGQIQNNRSPLIVGPIPYDYQMWEHGTLA